MTTREEGIQAELLQAVFALLMRTLQHILPVSNLHKIADLLIKHKNSTFLYRG